MAIVGLAAGYGYSKHEIAMYKASATIVVNTQSVVGGSGSQSGSNASKSAPARFNATEAGMAASPSVAAQAIKNAKVTGWTPKELLGKSTIVSDPNSNLVHFTVVAHNPTNAIALVNAYGNAAAAYNITLAQNDINSQLGPLDAKIGVVNGEIASTQEKIDSIKTQDPTANTGPQDALLRQYTSQLSSLTKTQTELTSARNVLPGSSLLTTPASGATQIAPATTRNIAAGLAVGIALGLGLAFLLEVMDARVRSAEDVVEELGLTLLARIPAPPRGFDKGDRVEMLSGTSGAHSEAYRKLRVAVDLANIDAKARTIMISSALDQEGKTTTIANLAVSMAQVGRRVTLVDLDLRRPNLGRQFGLNQMPGLTDIALGDVTLEDATHSVALPGAATPSGGHSETNGNGNGSGRSLTGVLNVITAGTQVHDPAAFLESDALGRLLEQVAERSDVVLIDAPPTLPVSDALTIATRTDAAIVLARLGSVRRHVLRELHRELMGTRAVVLGVVVTAAEADDGYGYGYGYGYRSPYLKSDKVPAGQSGA